MEWFDSHCHIHLCEADGSATADAVIDRARESGVTSMLTVGIDVMSSRRNAQIATEFGIWATAGVHPNSASEWDETAALAIESLLSQERVVAVGETGLDFYRDRAPREAQERAFGDHIELAKRTDRALVIHTRDSVDGAMDVLDERGPPERMVFHCWSGGRPQLARALDMGAWISFAGNVSFKSADDLREAARNTPANRLLVETDSPFLAPVPHRGRANEPAFVADVGAAVARARGVQMDEIAASTSENARALFGLK